MTHTTRREPLPPAPQAIEPMMELLRDNCVGVVDCAENVGPAIPYYKTLSTDDMKATNKVIKQCYALCEAALKR